MFSLLSKPKAEGLSNNSGRNLKMAVKKKKSPIIPTVPETTVDDSPPLAEPGPEKVPHLAEKEVFMTENQIAQTTQPDTAPPEIAPPSQPEVDSIIRNRVYASLAVGLVPVPLFDLGALAAVQVELLYRLSKVYNQPFNQKWARKSLALILGTLTPIFFTPTLSGLLRYVPVVGNTLGLAGGSLSFATATYLVGHAFAKRYAKGQTVEDKDLNSISQEVKSGFEKGKNKVKNWLSSDSSPEAQPEAN
jgi:uncharacterized protein (DUF697 family)